MCVCGGGEVLRGKGLTEKERAGCVCGGGGGVLGGKGLTEKERTGCVCVCVGGGGEERF